MNRAARERLRARLEHVLIEEEGRLPGAAAPENRRTLVAQLIKSVRRVQYVGAVKRRAISPLRADPTSSLFDPVRAAALHGGRGDIDEAFWLVFLFVHFGKHRRDGYALSRQVYGRLGGPGRWDWQSMRTGQAAFRRWLDAHRRELGQYGFGNHRKYLSLDAYSPAGTGSAVASYVDWVERFGSHRDLVDGIAAIAGDDPRQLFRSLYGAMGAVASFGRTARFDYLAMVGKLELARIEPDAAYLTGATGPLAGARLLFGGDRRSPLSPAQLENRLRELDERLNVGMQALEDALCNWQKSPTTFRPFRE